MRPRRLAAESVVAAAILLLSPPAPALADRLVTTTGKTLEGKISTEGERCTVQFASGARLTLDKKFVKEIEIEGDMSSYVPKDEREKEMLAKGYVKYRGQWVSKDRYRNEMNASREAAAKRLEEFRQRQVWGNEWTKETKFFAYHCNVSPEFLDHYVDLFENFYAFYAQRFQIKISPTMQQRKMTVNIFRDRNDYVEYSKRPSTGGYFTWSDYSLNLYHDFEDLDLTEMVLFHEGTHMVNYLLNPTYFLAVPIWLVESMAEWFSNCRIDVVNGKRKFAPGQVNEFRLGVVQERIAQGKPISLEKILTTPQAQFDGGHYAFAWSFVYFLSQHPKYSKGFFRFFSDIYDGKGMKFEDDGKGKKISNEEVIRALLKYLGAKDLASLEKEWLEYVKGLKIATGAGYFYRARQADWTGKAVREGETTASDASDALQLVNKAIEEMGYRPSKAYFLRSQILTVRGKTEEALADLCRAIELDPTNARYYAARAWRYNRKEAYAEAENDLRIAVELEPLEQRYAIFLESLLKKDWVVPPSSF